MELLPAIVRGCDERCDGSSRDSLLAVTFHDPDDDNAVEVEIGVDGDEDSCDWVCDTIFKTFLEWKPEYESMIDSFS